MKICAASWFIFKFRQENISITETIREPMFNAHIL